MLDTIITNKTRIKLLVKFFLNNETTSYLRKLESEFGESTNSIRIELNRLESAGLLDAFHTGNKKFYKANTRHPLYNDLNSIIRKFIGIDRIIEKIALQAGELKAVYLTGDIARGIDSHALELILIGNELDAPFISNRVKKAKKFISRNIKYKIYPTDKADAILLQENIFLIWQENDSPFYTTI